LTFSHIPFLTEVALISSSQSSQSQELRSTLTPPPLKLAILASKSSFKGRLLIMFQLSEDLFEVLTGLTTVVSMVCFSAI
jgi:hypothetical protein